MTSSLRLGRRRSRRRRRRRLRRRRDSARATKISSDEELLLKTAIDRSLVDESWKSVATKVHTTTMPPLRVQTLTSCTAVAAPSQTHPPVGASFGLAAIVQGQRALLALGIDFGIPARGMCHMPLFCMKVHTRVCMSSGPRHPPIEGEEAGGTYQAQGSPGVTG